MVAARNEMIGYDVHVKLQSNPKLSWFCLSIDFAPIYSEVTRLIKLGLSDPPITFKSSQNASQTSKLFIEASGARSAKDISRSDRRQLSKVFPELVKKKKLFSQRNCSAG